MTILCIGATPAWQRVMVFPRVHLDEVNRAVETLEGAAGKSINVARVLKTLGQDPVATGFLGGDRGARIRAVLDAASITHDFVQTPDAATRECTTVIDQQAGTQTELVEESKPVAPACYTQLLDAVRRHLPRCRAAIMSGSITPGGPPEFYATCTALLRAVGGFAVVDASGPLLREALSARPALVKPNRKELAVTLGTAASDMASLQAAMRQLHAQGAERVVVTGGAEPTLAFDGARFWVIRAPRIRAVNPIGSGDSFTAALVGALLGGADLGEACRHGAAAGTANALTLLPGSLDPKTYQALLRETDVQALP